jgi:hypothetical protein
MFVQIIQGKTSKPEGDPGQAGFVRIMQGHGTDLERARQLVAQDPGKWAASRPDVVGSHTLARQISSADAVARHCLVRWP